MGKGCEISFCSVQDPCRKSCGSTTGLAGAGPERTRMQVLALATAALPQSSALSQAGTDLLRSKSLSATGRLRGRGLRLG